MMDIYGCLAPPTLGDFVAPFVGFFLPILLGSLAAFWGMV